MNQFVKIVKRGFWVYLIEMIIAVLIFNLFGLEAFLIYALIMIIIKIDVTVDFLRKMMRVFQVTNEGKLMAIITRLGITQLDLQKIGDDIENNLTEEQKNSLWEDMDDLDLK